MRHGFSSVCVSALLVGCFEPGGGGSAVTDTDATGSTDGPTGGTTPSTSVSASDPTTTSPTSGMTSPSEPTSEPTSTPTTDPTGGGDDPPEVSLLVNGSATPGDATTAQLVLLEADATDDGTIDRVEFFDGDVQVAVVDAEPYTAEVLVTSIDNATHSFQARAYDDADQEGVSDTVDLAVDIEGGGSSASETNVWQTGGIVFNPGGGATIDPDGNIIVMAPVSTTDFEVTGVGAVSFTSDLSDVNWQVSEPTSLVDGQPQYLPLGQPFLNGDGSVALIGGNEMGTDGVLDPNASVFRFDAANGDTMPFVSVSSNPDVQNVPVAGLCFDGDGNMFLHGPDDNITKYSTDDGGVVWESPSGLAWTTADLGMFRMRADSEGDLVTDRAACGGGGTCTLTTTKINGFDGVEQWSEDIAFADDSFFFSLGVSAPAPNGGVITLHGPAASEGGGVHITRRDADGDVQEEATVLGPEIYAVMDVAVDAQGEVVAVGTRDTMGTIEAWAARMSSAGDIHWERAFGFGDTDDHALSLATTRDGKLVVVGFSDLLPTFIVFNGDLWVALLEL